MAMFPSVLCQAIKHLSRRIETAGAAGLYTISGTKKLRLAADQGSADAQTVLGHAYADGEGVPQDDEEAVKWYRLAADQGHAEAQYQLGIAYRDGMIVPQDDEEAVKWWRLAADSGNARAQRLLGMAYLDRTSDQT
ncbi:MAG: hypothetical protein CMD83_10890 [Gammaproteobacteria bacterium]|nr:hypothetical protein [Gammaproteobacteria bacterium]